MNTQKQTIANWLGQGSINIFGLPFAGKDTQGNRLAELFDGVVISSGDVLRHDHGNQEIQRIMAEGGIIPSELFGEVVVPYLSRPELAGRPLILSEVGRMEGEQQVVMKAAERSNHPTKAVVLLKLEDKEVWRRFDEAQKKHDRGDREDDNKAVLQNRLDKYHEKVTPVINWYSELGLLIEVDGAKNADEVTAEILQKLVKKASST